MKQRQRRGMLRLIISILRIVQTESKPSRIMYRAGLSWESVNVYFDKMVDAGFLQIRATPNKAYFLTDEGHQFLKDYGKPIQRMVDELAEKGILKKGWME